MKCDKLWWRSFWFDFWGKAMFDNFTLLPILVGIVAVIWPAPEADIIRLSGTLSAVFTLLSLLSAWSTIENATWCEFGIRRKHNLLRLIRKGKDMMLYGNPVGWVIFLLYFFLWKRVFAPFVAALCFIEERTWPEAPAGRLGED